MTLRHERKIEMTVKADGSSMKKIKLVSCLFMGLGHILYLKEYVKGFLFAAVEFIAIGFLPFLISKISDLITLGEPQPNLPVKQRDNSVFMLIDGVLVLAVIAVFLILYIISVKSAVNSYKDYCINGSFKSNKASFNGMLGKSFPVLGLLPTVIMVLFFVIVPLVFSVLVAFTDYSSPDHIPPNNTVNWVGFDNFISLFGGEAVWAGALGRVAMWTLVWAVFSTLTCYFGGMIMAVMLKESKIKSAPFFRAIFILPYAVPSVISMLVWRNLLNGSFGTVNRTLMSLGIISDTIPWLSSAGLAKIMCIVINLWAGFPYFMLMTMGSMTAISEDVYEAAKIDGATKYQTFKGITLPLVLYQTMPLIIMSFTHNINNFGAIFFLTDGEPAVSGSTLTSARGTDILITWIYNLTIKVMRYNFASVLACLIFVVLAPFAIYNFMQTKAYKEGEL